MKLQQEPKYDVVYDPDARESRIFNRDSGEVIPDDEPVFIFRARDRHVCAVLIAYAAMVRDPVHMRVILERLAHFRRFAENNPERMKEPDTDEEIHNRLV